MDLKYLFSNEKDTIEKAEKLNLTVESLTRLTKDILALIEPLSGEEIEDFIYRLKLYYNQINNKEQDLAYEGKIPARASDIVGGKHFFFRHLQSEYSNQAKNCLFYCELCGPNEILKSSQFKTHVIRNHT